MSASFNLAHHNTEETRYVNIQCTRCRTRFAVESDEVTLLSNPKFHCSCCDNVFREGDAFIEQPKSEILEPAVAKSEEQLEDAGGEDAASIDDGIVAVYRNSTKIASFFRPKFRASEKSKSGDKSAGLKKASELKSAEEVTSASLFEGITFPDETRQLQIPKQWDESLRSKAPRESIAVTEAVAAIAPASAPLTGTKDFLNSINDVKAQTMPTRIPNAHKSDDTIEIESFGSVRNAPLSEGQFNHYKADSLMPLQSRYPRNAARTPVKVVNFWSYLAAPVLFFLGTLLVLALVLQTSAGISSKFVHMLLPGALAPAPGDLFIKNTKFDKILLDSGESVRVISGTVVNNSQNSFVGAELQTVLFDRTGRPIGSVRTKLNTNLAAAKIHALTPEMIRDIQGGLGAKHLVLRPGETREFAVAIVGNDFPQAKDFATRIYSAKE